MRGWLDQDSRPDDTDFHFGADVSRRYSIRCPSEIHVVSRKPRGPREGSDILRHCKAGFPTAYGCRDCAWKLERNYWEHRRRGGTGGRRLVLSILSGL